MIGAFTMFDDPYRPVSNITIPSLGMYCARHGYELKVYENPPILRTIVWDRIQVILNNIDDYDWMVHFDADVLITNHNIKLEEFLDRDIVLSESVRENGDIKLNDGVIFVKNSDRAKSILQKSWDMNSVEGIFCAQDAFQVIYDEHPHSKEAFSVEKQKRINSFLYSEYGMPETTRGNWTEGDFALHLPGRTTERRVEIFNNTRIIK